MKRIRTLLCGVLALFGLAACEEFAIKDLRPGVSTGFEVRDRLGPPGIEWRNGDGTVTWEYSMQPAGVTCYLITIDANNVVQAVDQVLTEAQFARITPGLDETQVRRLIGKPAKTTFHALKQETVHDWLIDNSDRLALVYFNVYFDQQGRVVRTGRYTERLGN